MECNKSHIRYDISTCISIHASLVGCNVMSEKVVTKFLDFNSCIPYGMQQIYNGCDAQDYRFQFMHPLLDATAKYSIHIPIYTIFCIYCVILSSFISFTQSYLSIHLPLLVRISQCFYVRLRFAPASYSSLVQKT